MLGLVDWRIETPRQYLRGNSKLAGHVVRLVIEDLCSARGVVPQRMQNALTLIQNELAALAQGQGPAALAQGPAAPAIVQEQELATTPQEQEALAVVPEQDSANLVHAQEPDSASGVHEQQSLAIAQEQDAPSPEQEQDAPTPEQEQEQEHAEDACLGCRADVDKDLASLVRLCASVEILDLQSCSVHQGREPIFTKDMAQNNPKLQKVVFRDGAMPRHIVDYRSALLNNTSLAILEENGRDDASVVEILLRTSMVITAIYRAHLPPLCLDILYFTDRSATGVVGNTAVDIRARHIRIGMARHNASYVNLLATHLDEGPWLEYPETIRFEIKEGGTPTPEFAEGLEKLLAAGLRVSYE